MLLDENILKLVRSSGLTRIEHDLISLASETILLKTSKPESEEEIPLCHSKIGGRPDLPWDFDWPYYQGVPLHFIAQINCEHMPKLDNSLLPETGMLSFFYDAIEQPWGHDPYDRGKWRVFYFQDLNRFERKSEPEEIQEEGSFAALAVDYVVQTTLPSWRSLHIKRLALDTKESELYWDLREKVEEYNGNGDIIHKVYGHPDNIQGDMLMDCQVAGNGIHWGSVNDSNRESLEAAAVSWKLLLQIDSDERTGMMWGDGGRIYFMIKEEDLKNANFDKVWLVLQCA